MSNSIFTIETVESRAGASMVIGIAGNTGTGKTYTAMLLALGLVNGDASKIGFMDTENRRGKLYADLVKGFKYGDFRPPHSPARYADGVAHFEKSGVEVLIIDSFTHEWEGIGGCNDIAYNGNPKTARWNLAKQEHKNCMNAILQSSMHVILCIRAREKVKIEREQGTGKTVFIPLGVEPVTEKNVMFEMTASLLMEDQGRRQIVLKCPAELQGILGRGNDYVTEKDGRALRAWIDGVNPVNLSLEKLRARLEEKAGRGSVALEAEWKLLSVKEKAAVKPFMDSIKAAATAFDRLSKIEADPGDESEATKLVREVAPNALTD